MLGYCMPLLYLFIQKTISPPNKKLNMSQNQNHFSIQNLGMSNKLISVHKTGVIALVKQIRLLYAKLSLGYLVHLIFHSHRFDERSCASQDRPSYKVLDLDIMTVNNS